MVAVSGLVSDFQQEISCASEKVFLRKREVLLDVDENSCRIALR